MLFVPLQAQPEYPLKNGKPTSRGIARYVEEQGDAVIREFQKFVNDTLYNTYIYTADLTDRGYSDSLELGLYYSNEIFITTAEVFQAYEVAGLTRAQRDAIRESNRFVKGVLFHELTHDYIDQISVEMLRIDSIRVDRAYQNFFRIFSNPNETGSTFIEEGVCEYVTGKMGELILPKVPFVPKSIRELNDDALRYQVYYQYASLYLTTFLDTAGLKRGIRILLHNPPPSQEEMLRPGLFFNRLELPGR